MKQLSKRTYWFIGALAFLVWQLVRMLTLSAYVAYVEGRKPIFTYENTQVSTIHNFQDDDDYVEYVGA